MKQIIESWRKFLKEEIGYHGSAKKFDRFDPSKSNYRSLTYFTVDKKFADEFAGGRGSDIGYVYTVEIPSSLKLFDATKKENLELLKPIIAELVQAKYKDSVTNISFNPDNTTINLPHLNPPQLEIKNPSNEQFVEYMMWRMMSGSWRILEGERILKYIDDSGYDGLITVERSTRNIGIFPNALQKIKITNIEEISVNPD